MEPNISNSGTTGAGQATEGQSLTPQTNANQTQRANTVPGSNRVTNQEGASFSGPSTPGQAQQQQQTGYRGSDST
jgi:hypothetical protein